MSLSPEHNAVYAVEVSVLMPLYQPCISARAAFRAASISAMACSLVLVPVRASWKYWAKMVEMVG